MFELKLGSGFDNMINLVALAKVSSFHVRSKKCDQNVTRPPGGSCRTSRAPESSQLVIVERAGALSSCCSFTVSGLPRRGIYEANCLDPAKNRRHRSERR
jgi:hypothetical protein